VTGAEQWSTRSGARGFLARLQSHAARPVLFARHSAPFWDDPHISRQLLAAHLDPRTDAASRRPDTIDRSVAWLANQLELRPFNRVLDLGCGPGLYAERLAGLGLSVTGVDISRYPDAGVHLRQTLVVDPDRRITAYRFWDRSYSPRTITQVLECSGFRVENLCADLAGTPYRPDSPAFAVCARKG
jgi:SAM-dependent methyltransferase